jgi:hypothetical protein
LTLECTKTDHDHKLFPGVRLPRHLRAAVNARPEYFCARTCGYDSILLGQTVEV